MPNSSTFKPSKDLKILKLPFPTGRVIAIGDVHGCIKELRELLVKVQFESGDTLIFLGDLVDRGPGSEDVVQQIIGMAKYLNVYSVLGNHDEKPIRYHYHQLKAKEEPGYKVPMRCPGAYNELSESSLEYLASCPHAIIMPNEGTAEPYTLCFVHAGIGPGTFHQPPNAFVRNRYFTRNVKDNKLIPVKSIEIEGIWYVPEGSHPWHYYWDGRWTILYGHSVNWSPEIVNNTIGIDGGCCFGGCLRAWVKDGNRQFFLDVPAKEVYSG